MLIVAFQFLNLIANFCDLSGQIRHMNLLVCLSAIVTKVLKPVISHLQENGYRVVIFLDDILLIGSSVEECLSQLSFLRDLLQSLGFVINVNKSQLIPVTRIVYLGFLIDTISMTLSLPDEKVDKIYALARISWPVLIPLSGRLHM